MRSLWLRAETKPGEQRTPLTPAYCKQLTSAGVLVFVERSTNRVFSDSEYEQAGCELVSQASWQSAPQETFVLGLKELPDDSFPLIHQHIYFGHAFKGQRGADKLLSRFAAGKGTLFDLESLVDSKGRRVAAFGFWAGFVGAALAVSAWAKQRGGASLGALKSFKNQDEMIEKILVQLRMAKTIPTALVIGAKGRCGTGALESLTKLGITVTAWDLEETKEGGPFLEILNHDLLVNCVLLQGKISPFLTLDMLQRPRVLSVISDVSCDPTSPHNPLPIYSQVTTLNEPCLRLIDQPLLDLIAVDHLPSLLPRESSEDFSSQLFPHLRDLLFQEGSLPPVWKRAQGLYALLRTYKGA